MDDPDILERWVRAHERGDTSELEECMAESFVFEQEGFPKALDKQEYLALVEELHHAFPDLGLRVDPLGAEEEGTFRWREVLSATHEQDLDLTDLGLPFFFSTGRGLDLAAGPARMRVEDGQVTEHVIEDASGGPRGLLAELQRGLDAIRREAREREPGRGNG